MDQDHNLLGVNPGKFPLLPPDEPALARANESLSAKVWGIRWQEFVPFSVPGTTITVERASYEQVERFARETFAEIYGMGSERSPFLSSEQSEARHEYYRTVGDFFVFRDGDRDIGIVVGSLLDWSAYYVRNMTMRPEYQGKGIVQAFWDRFLLFLSRFEIARVEADVAPSNHANLYVLTKQQFNVIGFTASEMWGTTIRLGRFLDPEHHKVFLKQFCVGNPSTISPKQR